MGEVARADLEQLAGRGGEGRRFYHGDEFVEHGRVIENRRRIKGEAEVKFGIGGSVRISSPSPVSHLLLLRLLTALCPSPTTRI
jgi:hypothetical protein